MNTWYTSDHHFYHKNVLKFEDRPYKTIEEMNYELINTWNKYIQPDDTVHYLGDLCFGSYTKFKAILEQLNGNIILYKGNHDDTRTAKKLLKEGYIKELHMVGDYIKVRSKETGVNYQLWLTHYPMEIGNRPRKFSVHGHIHSEPSQYKNQINVGIDSQLNFGMEFGKPISEEMLINYLDYINPSIEKIFKKEMGKE